MLCEIPRLPGQPKKRSMIEQINAKAHAAGATPLDYVLGRIEDGEYLWQIGQDVSGSEHMLRRFCYSQPEGRARFAEAMRERAHSIVEGGMKRIEDIGESEPTKEEVMLLKVELDHRRFIAGSQHKEVYGSQPAAVNLNLSLGGLHLDALRQVKLLPVQTQPLLPSGEADYTIEPG